MKKITLKEIESYLSTFDFKLKKCNKKEFKEFREEDANIKTVYFIIPKRNLDILLLYVFKNSFEINDYSNSYGFSINTKDQLKDLLLEFFYKELKEVFTKKTAKYTPPSCEEILKLVIRSFAFQNEIDRLRETHQEENAISIYEAMFLVGDFSRKDDFLSLQDYEGSTEEETKEVLNQVTEIKEYYNL